MSRYRSKEACVTAGELRLLLDYDPETGIFTWRRRDDLRPQWNSRYAGTRAGAAKVHGRRWISINKTLYLASRLAWLYVHGEWPNCDVDHKDADPGNDRINNLRLATFSQNNQNTKLRRNNKSGRKGVCWSTAEGKWRATINIEKRRINLGYFDDLEQAGEAYAAASAKLHGSFGRVL